MSSVSLPLSLHSQSCGVQYNTSCPARTETKAAASVLRRPLLVSVRVLFMSPDICCFWSCRSEKGGFCRVTTCQNEHLQGRMGGPVDSECTSVPESDTGPINAAVCCCGASLKRRCPPPPSMRPQQCGLLRGFE